MHVIGCCPLWGRTVIFLKTIAASLIGFAHIAILHTDRQLVRRMQRLCKLLGSIVTPAFAKPCAMQALRPEMRSTARPQAHFGEQIDTDPHDTSSASTIATKRCGSCGSDGRGAVSRPDGPSWGWPHGLCVRLASAYIRVAVSTNLVIYEQMVSAQSLADATPDSYARLERCRGVPMWTLAGYVHNDWQGVVSHAQKLQTALALSAQLA